MSHHDLSARLRELSTSPDHRSQTARLRDVINDVELAISAGVALEHILSELHQDGFTFGMAGFKSALMRIRRRNGCSAPRQAARAAVPAATQLAAAAPTAPPTAGQTPTGRKSREQLAAEHPELTSTQITKMYAEQFNNKPPSTAMLDQAKARLGSITSGSQR